MAKFALFISISCVTLLGAAQPGGGTANLDNATVCIAAFDNNQFTLNCVDMLAHKIESVGSIDKNLTELELINALMPFGLKLRSVYRPYGSAVRFYFSRD